MTRDFAANGRIDFQPDFLAWIALRHFLSADLLRELTAVAVAESSSGLWRLEDLLDDHLSGTGPTAVWTVAPRPVDNPVARFLQTFARAMAWANDADLYEPRDADAPEGQVQALGAILDAANLGRFDGQDSIHTLERLRLPETSTARGLAKALGLAADLLSRQAPRDWTTVDTSTAAFPPLLRLVATKHIGDLCADGDAWDEAARNYDLATRLLEALPSPIASTAFVAAIRDMIRQSRATAAQVVSGPAAASSLLSGAVAGEDGAATVLFALNASHDALVASIAADELGGFPDLRTAVLLPPQLLATQNLEAAIGNALSGQYPSAFRQFWAVLRRQIALGSAAESRETKAAFARAMFSHVAEAGLLRSDANDFEFAVMLLIESGHVTTAKRLSFDRALLRERLTGGLIESALQCARRYAGVKLERLRVLVELFAHWLDEIDPEQSTLAEIMLRALIEHASEFEASFSRSKNLTGRSLEVLNRVAERRPEQRRLVLGEVAELCRAKIASGEWWTGRDQALKLAANFAEAWPPEIFSPVIEATLDLLANDDRRESPLLRPAMALLTSSSATELARGNDELGTRLFSTVLRCGLLQMQESLHLLFHLANLQPDLRLEVSDQAAFADVVATAKARARDPALSNSSDYINALIAAGAHVGADGVSDALDALKDLLRSAESGRRAGSFAYAYNPVLHLGRHRAKLAARSGMEGRVFQAELEAVGDALTSAWRAILTDPLLLRGFAIPPERRPNATLVHNWAVATREFASQLNDRTKLMELLVEAEHNFLLGADINRARVFWFDPTATHAGELNLADEPTETFYSALGHRLSVYWKLPEAERAPWLRALMQKCIAVGPRSLDAAVWTAALHSDVDGDVSAPDLQDYVARADRDEGTRQAVVSLLFELQQRGKLPKW